jgi:hypothetical protein
MALNLDLPGMTAADSAPPIRLDRYLALLAVLLAIVLGLLVMSERQRQPLDPGRVEGVLPPPPDPRVTTLEAERLTLVAEQERLTATLAATEQALRDAEVEASRLARENARLTDQIETRQEADGTAQGELAQRLAAVEAERDRLADEVRSLTATRRQLEARIASLTEPPPAAPRSPSRDPAAAIAAQPSSLHEALGDLLREQRELAARDEAATTDEPPAEADAPIVGDAPSSTDTEAAAEAPVGERAPRRLITFNGAGGSVADGIAAYRAGDYAEAGRIWGALAAGGDARAQFLSARSCSRDAPPSRTS